MKKLSKQLLALVAITALTTPVFASGIYAGASVGYAQADEECDALDDIGFVGSCDDDDTGWKIKAGYQFTPNWGVEVFYVDFGEADASGTVGVTSVTAEAELDAYGIAAVGTLPISEQFSVYAKAGVARWDADGSGTAAVGPINVSASVDDDGTDFMCGLGASYSLTENITIQAEWEYYDEVEVDFISAGFVYKFY